MEPLSTLTRKRLIRCGQPSEPQYLTGIDLMIGHPVSPLLMVYPQGLDALALAQSLAKVLVHYPLYAQRLKRDAQGHVYLDGVDAGVIWLSREHAHDLPAYGVDHLMDGHQRRYYRPVWPWRVVDHDQSPLMIEVNTFACGGVVLAVTCLHSVSDGCAFWAFMLDWARVHQGHPITPPALDRRPLIEMGQAHRDVPYTIGHIREIPVWRRAWWSAQFLWQYATTMQRMAFHIPAQQIERWRESEAPSQPQESPTSGPDLIIALCMRTMSSVMPPERPRYMGLITDLRFRRMGAVARKYVGNALGQDLVELSAQDLSSGSLADVAARCRVPMDHVSLSDLHSYLALVERHRQARTCHHLFVTGAVHCLHNGVIVNNCAHFPIYKIDFGRGPATWCDNEPLPYRKLMILPAPGQSGGFVVQLTARRGEIAAMRRALTKLA